MVNTAANAIAIPAKSKLLPMMVCHECALVKSNSAANPVHIAAATAGKAIGNIALRAVARTCARPERTN